MRPSSRGGTSLASTGRNILGLKGPAEARSTQRDEPSKEAQGSSTSNEANEARAVSLVSLEKGVRDNLMRLFLELDHDGDGSLNQKEFAAAKQLLSGVCGELPGSVKQPGVPVRSEDFMSYVASWAAAARVTLTQILREVPRQLARKPSNFDESVSELKLALVRNVSNISDEPSAAPSLWRTSTGSSFPLPPGADGNLCRMAFKTMQFLGNRTEDKSIIEASLVARMSSHRPMFQKLLDQGGEVLGLHMAGSKSVDVYLGKSGSQELLRIRLKELSLSSDPEPLLDGIGGFDVGPVEERDVPHELWTEMSRARASTDAPKLVRAPSQISEDLQSAPLVLTAVPLGRHIFKIRLKLLGNQLAANYLLLVPKLRTSNGQARYKSHKATLRCAGKILDASADYHSFLLFNARGDQVADLVLEHEFLNQRVRVQSKEGKFEASEVVPVPELDEMERVSCLSCNSRSIRSVLQPLGLERKSGERDIAYAMRLGRALRNGYAYDTAATEADLSNLTTSIWEKRRGDCSAFNAGFVFALRAFDIPARISLGFKYGSAVQEACGATVAPHAQAEFFADGIGWVPCDATTGVHRFGHEATHVLSFVEWRTASASLQEVNDLRKVVQKEYHSLHKLMAKLEGPLKEVAEKPVVTKEFAKILSQTTSCSEPEALSQIQAVLQLSNQEKKPSAARTADLLATFELGQFRTLGTGDGLTEAARAGLKMFEGGPYKGQALRAPSLNENMLIPDEINAVMEHVGAKSDTDWSKLWPYGVFSCKYDFDHQPP